MSVCARGRFFFFFATFCFARTHTLLDSFFFFLLLTPSCACAPDTCTWWKISSLRVNSSFSQRPLPTWRRRRLCSLSADRPAVWFNCFAAYAWKCKCMKVTAHRLLNGLRTVDGELRTIFLCTCRTLMDPTVCIIAAAKNNCLVQKMMQRQENKTIVIKTNKKQARY